MTLVDLEEIAKLGKENGAITMVDSTFASSFNQKPIQQGINIVIHSWWVNFEKNIICCSQPSKIYYNLYIRRKDTILVCYYSQQTRSKHNLRKHEVNVQEKMFFGEACHVHVKLDGVVTETTVKNNLRSMSPNLK